MGLNHVRKLLFHDGLKNCGKLIMLADNRVVAFCTKRLIHGKKVTISSLSLLLFL